MDPLPRKQAVSLGVTLKLKSVDVAAENLGGESVSGAIACAKVLR